MSVTRCSCVDVHAHVVPAEFPSYLPQPQLPGWPSMAPAHACHRHVMIDGAVYRTVSERCWNTPLRLSDMADMGVGLQAISPMPELFSYWLPAGPATALLRYINDTMAEMVARADGALVALGAVPLQDVDSAIAELHRVREELGFAGVEIGSNVNGRPIGAPEFEPFFAAAASLGAAVFVHAVRPAGMDRLVGPKPLQQALGYPTDIGLAAASVITSNLTLRHPSLRIAFSHGGGTLGLLLPRLEKAFATFPALANAVDGSPRAQAQRLYYDALVFDAATLRHLVSVFGDSQIMVGTDYPFAFRDQTPVASIEAAIDSLASRDRLLHATPPVSWSRNGAGMTEFPVVALRSIDIVVPDLAAAGRFYRDVWGLIDVEDGATIVLRATGDDHHVLVMRAGAAAAIAAITFRVAAPDALALIAAKVPAHGGRLLTEVGPVDWPGGGIGLAIEDPQGRILRFVHGDARRAADRPIRDRVERLSHVNINSHDVDATRAFFTDALGFRLTDRSKMMAFVRCNSDHHAIVIADAPVDGLNHIAFMIPDLEGVLMASGRMVDHGFPIAWGVGRHGPGNNVFAYFVDPFGIVIEYTADVLQVDDSYQVRWPKDWVWPPGRTDLWGIAPPKTDHLKAAQLAIPFVREPS